ncbi:MAG: FAD-dependent thymidylate synthase [Cuniculiplasma sp.]
MTNTNFFSNQDKKVFILKMESQIDRGALLSRYSRTSNLDIRDLYKKEFEENPERGKKFYERVFLEYGDESVAELVTVQLGIQGVSNIVTKIIEEARVGLSYLEKSSRYVSYEKKLKGKYLYLNFDETGIDKKFESRYNHLMDSFFELYSFGIPIIEKGIRKDYPETLFNINDQESALKAYNTSIRSRTMDEIRSVLPAATVTNLGISGNIRAFIYLIQRLDSSGLPEAISLSNTLYEELFSEFENLIKSARDKYGTVNSQYLKKFKNTEQSGKFRASTESSNEIKVELLDYTNEPAGKIADIFKFSMGNHTQTHREEIIKKIGELRQNRRNKIPREFEFINLSYRVTINYGAFRELQRHRFLSIIRKSLNPSLGYYIPEYIRNNEQIYSKLENLLNEAETLFSDIQNEYGGEIAQYILPYCTNYEILIHTNLRELVYFSELRSTPQSHPDLRELSIKMVDTFLEKEKEFEPLFKFMDRGVYPIGRFFQEYSKEEKIKKL